jgi:hypothetical protein
MKTNTTRIDLAIDGIKIEVGCEFLDDIVKILPDTKENKKVFEKLASSDNYEIRELIAKKDNLSKKAIKLLLADKREGIITKLLKNSKVAKKLTHKQIKNIIALDNPVYCKIIASNLEYFTKCNIKKLVKYLSNHHDPKVRLELVNRWKDDVSVKIIKKLIKDKDIDVAKAAKLSLLMRRS